MERVCLASAKAQLCWDGAALLVLAWATGAQPVPPRLLTASPSTSTHCQSILFLPARRLTQPLGKCHWRKGGVGTVCWEHGNVLSVADESLEHTM